MKNYLGFGGGSDPPDKTFDDPGNMPRSRQQQPQQQTLKGIMSRPIRSCILLMLFVGTTSAASLESLAVSLSDTTINAESVLTVSGQTDFPLQASGCFRIKYAQPYEQSKDDYNEYKAEQQALGRTIPDFYVPFPSTLNPSLKSSSPSASVSRIDDHTVQVQLTQAGSQNFEFKINTFLNPFSQLKDSAAQSSKFKISHYENCQPDNGDVATSCNPEGCEVSAPDFTSPAKSFFGTPTPTIGRDDGGPNMIGSRDGYYTFEIPSGKYFPKYGGKAIITLPGWYGEESEPVFTVDYTECSSDNLVLVKQVVNTQVEKFRHDMIIQEYTESDKITIKCTFYRNPVYRQSVEGFRLEIIDRESVNNQIFETNSWALDTTDSSSANLQHQTLADNAIDFQFYENRQEAPSPSVRIQYDVGLSISFQMPVPVEKTLEGCYMKIQFPKEIQLPDPQDATVTALIFQSQDENMMSKSTGSDSLSPGQEVFDVHQKYQTDGSGNYLVFKGCDFTGGSSLTPFLKITHIFTPLATKTTSAFTIELYKSFNEVDYSLSNKILEGSGVIDASKFRSGELTNGKFSSQLNFIQVPAPHTIEFTLTNALPQNSEYDNRIVIMMPDIMTASEQEPDVKNLDGRVKRAAIKRLDKDDYDGCDSRVCYEITHVSGDIPGGSTLQFVITGTDNQVSVQTAGKFKVQTQLKELSTESYYNIDAEEFDSNFLTERGGISLTSGKKMTSNNYVTYADNAVYTLYFTLSNYIPLAGMLVVLLPKEIQVIGNPYADIDPNSPFKELTNGGYGTTEVYDVSIGKNVELFYINYNIPIRVEAGDYTITFGGIKNPRSFDSSGIFQMNSTDGEYQIGYGTLDNIRMTEAGKFTEMTILQSESENGVQATYTVTFKAKIPVSNHDIFYLVLPNTIDSPKEPICNPILCLDIASTCTSEKGRIVVDMQVTDPDCLKEDAEFSFDIEGITNAASKLHSEPVEAYFTSQTYQLVAEFQSEKPIICGTECVEDAELGENVLVIANEKPGYIDEKSVAIDQASKDFGVENMYTVRFKPKNSIPNIGWIKLVYPTTVTIANEAKFIENCEAVTSASYKGEKHCKLIKEDRVIWIFNAFMDQTAYTSEIAINILLTNPVTNREQDTSQFTDEEKTKYEYDTSFHISTYTFDLHHDFPDVLSGSQYSPQSIQDFIDKALKAPDDYTYLIDEYPLNNKKPQLKCNAPCYTCLDSNPDYCSSCWGPGSDKSNLDIFLQRLPGKSTCMESCADGFTTNGNIINANDAPKTYYKCVECEMFCRTCQGQAKRDEKGKIDYYGKAGDTQRCVTCSEIFQFLVAEEEKCYVTCGAGYYEKIVGHYPEPSECGICKAPCNTCKKCTPGKDKNCDAGKSEPSAEFCTSCKQEGFFPSELEEIDTKEQYFVNQAGMQRNDVVILNDGQKNQIAEKYAELTLIEFLNTPVDRDTSTGLDLNGLNVGSETTFKDLYMQQWNKFDFPTKSLHENQCLAFCPDGFASVNGICLPCKSPCETCRGEVTRCKSCLQNQPAKYVFGSACYEECPKGTIAHDGQMRCLGCIAGCLVCDIDDQEICYECEMGLLLHQDKCLGACPDGFRPTFDGKRCEPEGELPVIWFPLCILTCLAAAIAIGGEFSSKNVFYLHRKTVSFYALVGVIDGLAIYAQTILTVLQGQYWMLAIPGLALICHLYLNFLYKKLWDEIDPPKPQDEEKLTKKEIDLINMCDEHFDKWNTKYFQIADITRKIVIFISHKFFQFPYSHFYGYLHCTLRTQDYYVQWTWDEKDCMKFHQGRLTVENVKKEEYKFKGRLLPMNKDGFQESLLKKKDLMEGGDQKPEDNFEGGSQDSIQHEGGQNDGAVTEPWKAWNPYQYCQHPAMVPRKKENMKPDNRIINLFKKQVMIDFIGIRLVLIGGNSYLILTEFIKQSPFQLFIQSMECLIISFIMLILQIMLLKNWEDYRLPFKMKDIKANYLFKRAKLANLIQDWTVDDDLMPEWNKYMHFYKFNEIFLDNKLEELLNIFGRRQCKSCIDFNTGWELEEDPRRTRSWPLSPRGELLYQGMAGDFDLIDFQLQDNVYAEKFENEPTQMFDSVARDFSDFGAQVFAFDVLEALNRKGGDLLTPGIENENFRRKQSKKKRGRKNKYYKQIDIEDDEEAKQISDESENDGLNQIKEQDDEDDEEEILRKRKEEEALKAAEEAKKKREQEEEARRQEEERKRKEDEILKEHEARKKAEEERIRREQEAKRKEQERKEQELAQKKKEEEQLEIEIEKSHTPQKGSVVPTPKAAGQSQKSKASSKKPEAKNFDEKDVIEVPPKAESRRFNECDIIGDLERDDKGNVIVNEPDTKDGKYRDNAGKETNQRGYLVDPATGDIVNNFNGKKMFDKKDLDERGEVPAPFNVEKHNFNPHQTRGDFDYDRNGKPVVKKGENGEFVDRRGSTVSKRGYRVDDEGNMIDNYGRKKFDKSQMTEDGDLPKLFNFNGRRFDITDTIGQVDKDENGNILPKKDSKGNLVDNLGRPINSKGYLIDKDGNVIDKDNRQIFEKANLQNDEIPKILPCTKFNVKNILGDFEMDPLGNPILDKDAQGNLIDRKGKRVNQKGYTIDKEGNVIDKNGKKMFDKALLDNENDIPKVYRTGLLKSDTASSLSRLMSEIERNQPSEFDVEERRIQDEIEKQMRRPRGHSGNTSVDSMMEDTPANYNVKNQRFDAQPGEGEDGGEAMDDEDDDDEDEYGSQYEMGVTGALSNAQGTGAFDLAKKRKKKKKKKKRKPVEMEDPSLREHLMAGAYGGIAKPKPKRQGVKYTTDLDAGLRDITTPGQGFVRDPSRKGIQASYSGFANIAGPESSRGRNKGRNRSSYGRSDVGSNIGSRIGSKKGGGLQGTSTLLDPQQREAQLKQQQMDEIRRKQIAKAKKKAGKVGKISKDADFEKMFGKDIDEFLEDSEWDIESIDKMSQFSKNSKNTIRSASNAGKLKGLEKLYLQRIDNNINKNTLEMSRTKQASQKGSNKFRGEESSERRQAWDTGSKAGRK